MSSGEDAQRRSDYRAGATYPIWYRDFSHSEGKKDWVRTVTRDLSGGGASFRLSDAPGESYKPNDLLELQIVIPPAPVFAIGRIVRVFQDERGDWYAGVMFASVEPRQKDRIVRIVLSEGVGRS